MRGTDSDTVAIDSDSALEVKTIKNSIPDSTVCANPIHFVKWPRLHEACQNDRPPPACHALRLSRVPTMSPKPVRPKRQENIISSLNVAIEALNLTKEILSITPAKAVCGSVSVILATIRVCFPPGSLWSIAS